MGLFGLLEQDGRLEVRSALALVFTDDKADLLHGPCAFEGQGSLHLEAHHDLYACSNVLDEVAGIQVVGKHGLLFFDLILGTAGKRVYLSKNQKPWSVLTSWFERTFT